ncbi:auxin-responsive protein IAA2 [Setaria viridis]|uniref:auxin-responsive protein IAA2 n=1 Tax=Setaria viridis TaxID=4556 RepID=UPI003B39FD51
MSSTTDECVHDQQVVRGRPRRQGRRRRRGRAQPHKSGGLFVKINMDGVPIGQKVDLTAYGGYAELSAAVGKLFRGLLAGTYSIAASFEAAGEEAEEPVISGKYTLVYKVEEGDRVLVGDVPWE